MLDKKAHSHHELTERFLQVAKCDVYHAFLLKPTDKI